MKQRDVKNDAPWARLLGWQGFGALESEGGTGRPGSVWALLSFVSRRATRYFPWRCGFKVQVYRLSPFGGRGVRDG